MLEESASNLGRVRVDEASRSMAVGGMCEAENQSDTGHTYAMAESN